MYCLKLCLIIFAVFLVSLSMDLYFGFKDKYFYLCA